MKVYKKHFNGQWKMPRDSRHHILPASRGGNNAENNIVYINNDLHERFHSLFANRTPEECIEFLVEYFFDGNYEPLNCVLNKQELLYLSVA